MSQVPNQSTSSATKEESTGKSDAAQSIRSLKVSERQRMLYGLTSLLGTILENIAANKNDAKLQQKWISTYGYIAQVSARIVTDLEYEKLRADVDRIVQQDKERDVIRQRGALYHSADRTTRPPAPEGQQHSDST